MIRALLRAAALVLVATLVTVAPVLGEPADAAAAQGVGGDLRSEYPLHDAKQCCSASPAPAAVVHQPGPGPGGRVDGDGGLTLWVLGDRACVVSGPGVARPLEAGDDPPSGPEPGGRDRRRRSEGGARNRRRRVTGAGGVPRAVRGIDVSRFTAAARAVPRAARKVDLKAVIPTRDRPRRGAPAPEPEPSGIIEDHDRMDDEPPTTARPDPPPEQRSAAPVDRPSAPPPPVRLDRPHRAGARTPEPEPSGTMEDRDRMADEPPTPARRDPPPERHLAAPRGRARPPPSAWWHRHRSSWWRRARFAEVEAIRDGFGASTAVVLDLRSTEPELANGLTYFASGFTFGLGGAMRELAADIYLLTPRDVEVSAEESARLLESLLPNPNPEEIPQQALPLRREDRFRVELDPGGGQGAVADGHHDLAVGGGPLQVVGELRVGDQGVVAAGPQRVRQPGEDARAIVLDLGVLAVDRLAANRAPAERLDHRLVAEADAEGRHALLGKGARGLDRDPGLRRRAGTGRDHQSVGPSLEQLGDRRLVVAHNLDLRPELAEVLDEVVGEAVVVVDDEDVHALSSYPHSA